MASKSSDSAAGCGAVIGLALIVAFLLVSFLGGCNPDYSDGLRSGELRKFSRKGLVWKSWEGQLLLSNGYVRNRDGSGSPDVWTFTVTDPEVAKRLEGLKPDAKVTLKYRQWLIKPMSQDSRYTVVEVK